MSQLVRYMQQIILADRVNFVHLGALLSESESDEEEDGAEGSLVNDQEDGDRQHDCEYY